MVEPADVGDDGELELCPGLPDTIRAISSVLKLSTTLSVSALS
jgi:hypothetical protein